jgi:methionyl-tRNA formyltransferase
MTAAYWPDRRRVSVVSDPSGGWFDVHAAELTARLNAAGHDALAVGKQSDVREGDIAFYLSCTDLTPPALLARNAWNIVVHASDLPQGRGFSPLVWQVLEGKNDIPLTMITMDEAADAGDIVMHRTLSFQGHELNDEMRTRMGIAIVEMCVNLVVASAPPEPRAQTGEPSWYNRRRADDSRLDVDRTIAEQFDLLRVVDNDRYPAFFEHRGHRYTLTIAKQEEASG